MLPVGVCSNGTGGTESLWPVHLDVPAIGDSDKRSEGNSKGHAPEVSSFDTLVSVSVSTTALVINDQVIKWDVAEEDTADR